MRCMTDKVSVRPPGDCGLPSTSVSFSNFWSFLQGSLKHPQLSSYLFLSSFSYCFSSIFQGKARPHSSLSKYSICWHLEERNYEEKSQRSFSIMVFEYLKTVSVGNVDRFPCQASFCSLSPLFILFSTGLTRNRFVLQLACLPSCSGAVVVWSLLSGLRDGGMGVGNWWGGD